MKTLSDLVFHVRENSAGRPELLSIKRHGRRETISTGDFVGSIHALALALRRRGVAKGDRVALFSENRPEWHIVDFACQLLGAISVPLYPTLPADQVGFILKNSGASWVFFSNQPKLELLNSVTGGLSQPPRLVALDEIEDESCLAVIALFAEGNELRGAEPIERLRGAVEPSDPASVIYTSGTTGEPKGVVLTHHNFISNMLACSPLFELGAKDQALSFLPLSHVFERPADHLFFYRGVAIHYSPTIERVPPLLLDVRPTVLASVPRVYERFYLKVATSILKEKPAKRRIFNWGVRVGKRYATARLDRFVRPFLGLQRLAADRLVYRKIKARFGGRLRFAISGGAPLGEEVAMFFEAVGIKLYQGYGLTETAPVLAVNHPRGHRLGSVGQVPSGIELEIADDGEILAKTPGLMAGYWENPEATKEVVDSDGWFHTGDIGHLDADGFLFITDRKKDLLVTSGGKNVAPAPIEQMLVANFAISQAIVLGDRFPYLTALLVPRFEELPAELSELPAQQAIEHPKLLEILTRAVDDVNDRLGQTERIRKWLPLPAEFTIESGEMTPTLKLRRKEILQRHQERISSMYLKTQQVTS